MNSAPGSSPALPPGGMPQTMMPGSGQFPPAQSMGQSPSSPAFDPFATRQNAANPFTTGSYDSSGNPFTSMSRPNSQPNTPPAGGGFPPTSGASNGLPPTAGSMGQPSMGQPVLGKELTFEVMRLMDMPIEDGLFGEPKSYRVRAFDEKRKELGKTEIIDGLPPDATANQESETFAIPKDLAFLRLKTNSKIIFLDVEYAGGMLGNRTIGSCKIHRHDPRSAMVWPYALTEPGTSDRPVNCGVELRVIEGPLGGPTPPGTPGMSPRMEMQSMPPGQMGLMQQSQGMPQGPQYTTMPPMGNPAATMMPGMMPGMRNETMPPMGGMCGPSMMGPPETMGPSMMTRPPIMDPMMGGPSMMTRPPIMDPMMTRPPGSMPMMPPPGSMSMMGPMGSMPMMPPGPMGSMGGGPMMGPGMMGGGRGPMQGGARHPNFQNDSHGVVTIIEFDKVGDLPYPKHPTMNKVILTILVDNPKNGTTHELRRVGPFPLKPQNSELLQADCFKTRVQVSAPLHFGGDAKEGAMYLKVGVTFTDGKTATTGNSDPVGETKVFIVGFRQSPSRYYEVRPKNHFQVIGGVSFTHRLLSENQAGAEMHQDTPGELTAHKQRIMPVEVLCRVSGRTGNFPRGSPEEAFEQAAINCEAQNRAELQRVKKISQPSPEDAIPGVRTVNGYREWDNLDALFATMGPNPLTMSEEVGPSVCRGFIDNTSIIKEVAQNLGVPRNPAEENFNLNLLGTMYKKDPFALTSLARPVICKDPVEIAKGGMAWCPDPAMYVPLRNMNVQDRETLNLSCYEPHQSAKLNFADANPNYQIGEDIWGVQAEYKAASSQFVQKPDYLRRYRVKDDCIMA